MGQPFIVLGDQIDHGGSVVAGSMTTDVDGKPVARIGDKVSCSQHGATTIATGDSTIEIDGSPVARSGDRTACGGTLVSSQVRTYVAQRHA